MKIFRRLGAAAIAVHGASLGFSTHSVKQFVPNSMEDTLEVPVGIVNDDNVKVTYLVPAQSDMNGKIFYFVAEKKADLQKEQMLAYQYNAMDAAIIELAVVNAENA